MRKWKELDRKQKIKRVRHIVADILRKIRGLIWGVWYWIRCHTFSRFHVVNVSGEDGYSWGWIDRDHLLLLASFKILRDYVEQENPNVGYHKYDITDIYFENLKDQISAEREIRILYTWWTIERPDAWKRLNDDVSSMNVTVDLDAESKKWTDMVKVEHTERSKNWFERELELRRLDDEMLVRLIRVRERLWT